MELFQILGTLLFIIAAWLIFLIGVGYGFGIGMCRYTAWWRPGQKVRGYVTVRSRRLARLLIDRYGGYNNKINTNIPALYNRFHLNYYPKRISYLGIFDWCITLPLAGWWAYEITRYFFIAPLLELEIGNGVFAAGITLPLYRVVMHFVSMWNNARAELGPELTKEELKAALKDDKRSI